MNEQQEGNPQDRGAGNISGHLRELLHRREEICARLEAMAQQYPADGDAAAAAIEEEFRAAPEVPAEYAEILDRRFAEAREKFRLAGEEAAKRRRLAQEKIAEASGLRTELERLESGLELGVLPSELDALEKRWRECCDIAGAEAVDDASFQLRFRALRSQVEAAAEAEAERTARALALADELDALTAAEGIEALQERKPAVEAEFAALGAVPKAAADRYRDAHRKAGAKLAQHYETLDLARWESYTRKLDLCAELEKLQTVPDSELPQAAKSLQTLRARWKELGSVPKEKADEINPRYLDAARMLQHRVDEYFARLRQTRKAAAARKQELCVRAAALAESTEWNKGAAEFKALQEEWKTLPGAGSAEKELYTAFRASADRFFNARGAWFAERNQRFDAAAGRKRELIAAAEALGEATPESVRRARELRAEYQTLGPAGRAEPELRAGFDAALDRFFAGRREAMTERENRARALIAEIKTMSEAPAPESERRFREIRAELRTLGCRSLFDAERSAAAEFERALADARGRMRTDQYSLLRTAGSALAALIDRFLSGETLPEEAFEIESARRFPKFANTLSLLRAAAGGDGKARSKLEHQLDAARREHERVIAELERCAGIRPEAETAPADANAALAAELAAAIAGNFAAASVKAAAKSIDPKRLFEEYLAAGILPSAEFAASLERFDRAYRKVR